MTHPGQPALHEFVDHASDRRVVIGGRRNGKTTALVHWALEYHQDRVILCRDQREADRLLHEFGVRALPWSTPEHALRGQAVEFAIDGIDDYIHGEFQGLPIALVSITGNDETPPSNEIRVARDAVHHYVTENARLRAQVEALAKMAGVTCDGRCLSGDDIGVPSGGIAYPDPECSLHGGTEAQLRALGIEVPA